ncbi:MAG TPA: zinc ribbon domain-containing protein [Thermoplasmata archaeon]|nr:zinc ribbon domain-containing protein [Thermoplasmata archaeon]
MFCTKCGATLPDDAVFCSKCGTRTGAGAGAGGPAPSAAPAAGGAPTLGAAGVQELKCPSCGAPIHPTFGETVISCDYCGGSVTLGGQGWKEINKHTMLSLKVSDPQAALKVVHGWIDEGFFHRHDFEESKILETKLTYVPFWIMPVSASTTFTYQAVATSVGATAGTIAAGALLGNALGGRRGGFTVVPIMAGPVVNPNRSDTITGQYEYPVIAVKAMTTYQPRDYAFGLGERTFFDKKTIPGGTTILNGDLSEDAAKGSARAYVQQLQADAAHKKHSTCSNLKSEINVGDAELLHAPIWEFKLEHKGQRQTIIVDGNGGRVIRTV